MWIIILSWQGTWYKNAMNDWENRLLNQNQQNHAKIKHDVQDQFKNHQKWLINYKDRYGSVTDTITFEGK